MTVEIIVPEDDVTGMLEAIGKDTYRIAPPANTVTGGEPVRLVG